jgi:ABC-type lipoprotein release transport system permease subunit
MIREESGDLIQGTLDMLILKALARGPLHGYAVAEWVEQTSQQVLKVEEGRFMRCFAGLPWNTRSPVAAFGAGAGLGAALLASRALASFLYGTSPPDSWVLVGSVAALTIIASLASLLPALRAARIEPMAAIRRE